LLKAATNLLKGQSIMADPLKYLTDDSGLFQRDLVPSVTTRLRVTDVAVSVGGFADRIDPALSGGMQLASTTPFHDLGPLIFGNHALHLQEQVLLGTMARRIIEEDYFDTTPPQFIDQENLIGVLTGQTIRRVDIEPVKGSHRRHVTKSLQGRPNQ
jgi:hypothetical protein